MSVGLDFHGTFLRMDECVCTSECTCVSVHTWVCLGTVPVCVCLCECAWEHMVGGAVGSRVPLTTPLGPASLSPSREVSHEGWAGEWTGGVGQKQDGRDMGPLMRKQRHGRGEAGNPSCLWAHCSDTCRVLAPEGDFHPSGPLGGDPEHMAYGASPCHRLLS
jgi:hypothetical protein